MSETTASYADRANQRRNDKFLKWPAGLYKVLFKGASITTGRNSPFNKMVNIEMAPIESPAGAEETVDKLKKKNKKIVHRFVFSDKGNGFEDFLCFLQDIGADLTQCRPESEDPDYADFMAIMQELELRPPQMEIELKWPEDGGQYYNVYFRTIPKVFGAEATAAPAGPGAPGAPGAPAGPAAEIIYYEGPNNTVLNGDRATVQALINAGYAGQVNINSTAWTDLLSAGFSKPAPTAAPVNAAAAVAENTPAGPGAPAGPGVATTQPETFNVDPGDNTIPADTAEALGQTQAVDSQAAATAAAAGAAPANPFGA